MHKSLSSPIFTGYPIFTEWEFTPMGESRISLVWFRLISLGKFHLFSLGKFHLFSLDGFHLFSLDGFHLFSLGKFRPYTGESVPRV